jgi:hypothetical protein
MPEEHAERPCGEVRTAAEWELHRAEGVGPFTSRLIWRLPDGGEASWESRKGRTRGVVATRADPGGATSTLRAAPATVGRLRRTNWVAAAAFTVGGSLFALGAIVAELGSGDALIAASIYFVGGLFFNAGAYASVLAAVNAPRPTPAGEQPPSWRWWAYEPEHVDWASAFVLLAGTIVFGLSLLDSLLRGLTAQETNRLIWTPEVVGCVLFLISGHLSMTEVCHRGTPCLRWRDLGWATVVVNQVGSALFFVSALAAFSLPETGSEVNVQVANWGTLTGAVCFAAAGVLQAYESRPESPS